jgi:rod shape determining protein RodA
MTDVRLWRHFDWVLLIVVVLLSGYGVTMIYSATRNAEDVSLINATTRQLFFVIAGLGVLIGVSLVDYRLYDGVHRIIYLLALILLVVALALGQSRVGDVRRWFTFGIIDVQPSEVAKILVVIVLAQYLASHEDDMNRWRVLLGAVGLLAVPVALVFLQPNLSTAVLLLVVGGAMIYSAGLRWYQAVMIGVLGVAALPVAWLTLQGYMRTRLLVFLDPAHDPSARYNIDQALIAIGSGGFFGKGFTNPSSLSQLHFLRVRHTDFIFSVIAEELGMLGVIVLFALLILLLFRMLRIASLSRDNFGRYIVIGFAMMIFFQAAVNIAMNLSLMPVAGLPLPFISYGGSSILTLMIALGVVESVAMRHKKLEF